jgi:SAM-dependent methyltransferase
MRGMLYALSMSLFGAPLRLPDFPTLKSIRGLGMSDDEQYAGQLASKFDYRNTYFDRAPFFDVAQTVEEQIGEYDFILCADVLEHVTPPMEAALGNILKLLKPHGFLLLTTPYSIEPDSLEHFPNLHEYSVITLGGRPVLVNRTPEGQLEAHDNLVFHGGPGSTLELRELNETTLLQRLSEAGFAHTRIVADRYEPFGIVHAESWSLPVIAARQEFVLPRQAVAELAAALQTCQTNLHNESAERQHLEQLITQLTTHTAQVEADFEERSAWALALQAEVQRLQAENTRLATKENPLWERLLRALPAKSKPAPRTSG